MPKRNQDSESKEDRNERKRRKKEAKQKKLQQDKEKKQGVETHPIAGSDSFIRQRVELTVSILPASLGDTLKSIEDSLRMLLLKYSDGLEGILLAFDNVKILEKGTILNELPHIHFPVTVDALIFAPTVGCQLTGVVTESFHSHLSLVVHHYFNASIAAEHMRQAGFEFDDTLEQWYWTNDGSTTVYLTKDDPVNLECQMIHESGGVISMAGAKPWISQARRT